MNTLSLFDEVINEVTHEIAETFENAYCKVEYFPAELRVGNRGSAEFPLSIGYGIQPSEVVYYTCSRTGRETSTAASRYYAASTLVSGLRKRYIGPSVDPSVSESARAQVALDEFLADNDKCRQYNKDAMVTRNDWFFQHVRGTVRQLLADVFERVTPSGFWARMVSGVRSGPGASVDVTGDNGSYSRLGNSAMSFSSRAARNMYISLCECSTPLTLAAEMSRQSLYGLGDTLRSYATFCSVPKTNGKNRGICTQASGNMAIQLAIHTVLVWILKRFMYIDLEDQQEKNKQLAYLGSLGPTYGTTRSWTLVTLDLHSASNFPWSIIVDQFPRWLVWILAIARSPYMVLPNGKRVRKHMCSTMGNGFTFALMTLFLSAIVRTLYDLSDLPEFESIHGTPVKTWGVYGDDIIVDRSVCNALIKVLQAYGFTINITKSCTNFTIGAPTFRESCGGDFMDGVNVRPVFVEKLQTQADIYSLLNRLILWGVTHSVELPRTVAVLRGAIKGKELRVPNWEDVCHGFHVPLSWARPSEKPHGLLKDILPDNFKGRVFDALQPVPLRRTVFREKTAERQCSILIPWESALLHFSGHEIFQRHIKWRSTVRVEYGNRHPNLCAVLLHMIGGSIRGGRYGVRRHGDVVYEVGQRYAPGWGDATLFTSRHTSDRKLDDVEAAPYRLWEKYVVRQLSPQPKAVLNFEYAFLLCRTIRPK